MIDGLTSDDWTDTGSQTESTEPIVENVIVLQRSRSVVGDLDASSQTVENPVAFQHGVAASGDEHAGLGIPEDVIVLQDAAAVVENANAAVAAVVYLVLAQRGRRVCLNPDAGHGVVEYLVALEEPEPAAVDEDTAVLAAPYLVPAYHRVRTRAYLDSGVQVVEDVVVFQTPVAVVVEIHSNLPGTEDPTSQAKQKRKLVHKPKSIRSLVQSTRLHSKF